MSDECTRCNIPHHDTDQAAKSGGMGRLISFERGFCGVCQDYRDERNIEALYRLIDHRQRDPSQEQLTTYENQ